MAGGHPSRRTGMAAEPTTPSPRIPILPGRIRNPLVGSAVSFPAPAGAVLALAGSVAVSLWVVLAAAQRRSFLSPPARHDFAPWLVGPLGAPPAGPDARHGHAAHGADRRARDPRDLLAVAWALAARVRIEWVVAALVLVHVVYALGPPLSLTDIFNYLHYGREGARYGQNPYAALPLARRSRPGVPLLELAPPAVSLRAVLHAARRGLAPLPPDSRVLDVEGGRALAVARHAWRSLVAGASASAARRSAAWCSRASTRSSSSTASAASTTTR